MWYYNSMSDSITIKNEVDMNITELAKQHFQTDQQTYKGLDKFSWDTMNNLYAILIVVIFLFLLTLCSVGGV